MKSIISNHKVCFVCGDTNVLQEIWKPIEGYEGLYEISNLGRVKALKKWDVNSRKMQDTSFVLNPTDNGRGYKIVGLRKNTVRKNHYVHRLVAKAFLEQEVGKNYVNHIDYDTTNNRVDNLEWCTQKENIRHSSKNMCHRKSFTRTNTGERYIYFSHNGYRVVVDHKECGVFKTLAEAVEKRNERLLEVVQ